MKHIRLTEKDWLKLNDFAKIFAKKIRKQLPADWGIEEDEIQGAVYDTFLSLLANYKPGAMSPTSYCYEFGCKVTLTALMREYAKLKRQVQLVEDNDDDEVHHEYVEADIDEYKSLAAHLEDKDLFEQVIKTADDNGLGDVARMLGTHTQAEIAKELGISQPAVA